MEQYWSRPWFRLDKTIGLPPPIDATPLLTIHQVRTKVNPSQGYATPHELCQPPTDVDPPWKVPPPLMHHHSPHSMKCMVMVVAAAAKYLVFWGAESPVVVFHPIDIPFFVCEV